jgi:hypothetical protein
MPTNKVIRVKVACGPLENCCVINWVLESGSGGETPAHLIDDVDRFLPEHGLDRDAAVWGPGLCGSSSSSMRRTVASTGRARRCCRLNSGDDRGSAPRWSPINQPVRTICPQGRRYKGALRQFRTVCRCERAVPHRASPRVSRLFEHTIEPLPFCSRGWRYDIAAGTDACRARPPSTA